MFVDTSAWYAAADADDVSNVRARSVLSAGDPLVTTDHVLLETWTLLRWRLGRAAADAFWAGIRSGAAHLEIVREADLEAAWAIGPAFPDQDFSLADRTSFAVMERLGLERVATFDADFSVYRYGPGRRRAFQVER
ncbi:MAG: PIN domain-containing protein [Gemmatimonadetes bacterium]|nr:PIN domain-containing protein [Gemmatimonadota bacterium]